jgi:NitT/TauT family transport system substrate-binding protein
MKKIVKHDQSVSFDNIGDNIMKKPVTCFWLGAAVALGGLVYGGSALAQSKNEITITRQPSILYLPTQIIEKQHLIEKQAAKLGIPNLKVEWVNFSGGGSQTDAMLAGSIDIVNTGTGNLLLLWDRTKGGVKGIVATSAQPVTLISRDPRIKSLKDYGPNDRIAVPTVRVSTQANILQIAAAQTFGADQWNKLDANTVQLGHPDAAAALSDSRNEVASHFAAPPFSFFELKNIPGAHVVLQSADVFGSPLTQSQFFTTTKFANANPKIIEAVKAATLESIEFIQKDTRGALEIYKEMSKDKSSMDDLLEMMKQPGMMDYIAAPQGSMKYAAHMYKVGTLKTMPKAWTDYYLPIAHDLKGN